MPKRRWYDLEAAAERLGCTRSDLEYYIKEGQLRFAVSTQQVLKPTGVALMRNSDLPQPVQGRLGSLVKPDLMRCFETTFSDTLAESVHEPGEFLYLPFGWLPRMYVTEDGFDEVRAHLFQLLDDTEVSLWMKEDCYRLWGERLPPLDSSGLLKDAIVSHEELERLLETHGDSRGSTEEVVFSPPEKADEIAQAICEFANRYVSKFGKAPEARALAAYMVEHGKEELGFTEVARDEYDFNGKRLKLRQIKERLKKYRSKSTP